MGVRQYNLGKKHALDGIRAMAHRNGRRYDSQHANESYHRGYHAGSDERYSKTGKVRLDYNHPMNNRLFNT